MSEHIEALYLFQSSKGISGKVPAAPFSVLEHRRSGSNSDLATIENTRVAQDGNKSRRKNKLICTSVRYHQLN